MKTTHTLSKTREFWLLLLHREDGTTSDYRFPTKRDAQRWLKLAGL